MHGGQVGERRDREGRDKRAGHSPQLRAAGIDSEDAERFEVDVEFGTVVGGAELDERRARSGHLGPVQGGGRRECPYATIVIGDPGSRGRRDGLGEIGVDASIGGAEQHLRHWAWAGGVQGGE